MLKRLVAAALAAGVAAGLIAVLLQFALVQPLLLEAEAYESGEQTHFAMPQAHDHGADAAAEMPKDGHAHDHASEHDSAASGSFVAFLGRDGLSLLFSVFTYVGFALVLVAAFQIASTAGVVITRERGLIWGLAGFAIFHFFPALGLAPELPGNASADLDARQVWWLATVIATALAFALLSFGRGWPVRAAGLVLLALPHVIGAPEAGEYWGSAPPELASAFAVRALATSLGAWLALGFVAGYVWRQNETEMAGSS